MQLLRALSGKIERLIGMPGLLFAAAVVFIASTVGAYSYDSDKTVGAHTATPSQPHTTSRAKPTTTTAVKRRGVSGFPPVAFTVRAAGNAGDKKYCGLLAQTKEQLSNGLMRQRDLGGYDGMIFHFIEDSTAEFYMANVPVPLSIAWFDKDGQFVSSAELPVCTAADGKDCPRFPAAGPFRDAIEVPSGGLGPLGIGAGSSLSMGGPCG